MKPKDKSRLEATSTLAGGVAHHINNYMAVIIGSSDILREETVTEEERAELLLAINKAANEAALLARHLLEFAQGGRLAPRLLSLNDVIERTVENCTVDFPADINVKLDLTKDLCLIEGDLAQMEELVHHLLMNGREAVSRKGQVTIRTENRLQDDKSYVKLTVSDDGCGMPPEVASRVFEPFFTTNMLGRGLGLSACHGIVTSHGGIITVNSKVGKGSTFEVTLPCRELTIVKRVKKEEHDVDPRKHTVLVVDDHVSVAKTTAFLLKKKGYRVVLAFDGQEALDKLQEDEAIDLVLIDLAMPVLGGAAAIELIKKEKPDLPIIVCSARGEAAKKKALDELKVSGYLEKPYKAVDLLNQIASAFSQ